MTDRHRYFCTYLDHRYIPRFLLLYDSLVRHCPTAELWVLCFDDECLHRLTAMHAPRARLIRMSDFEARNPDVAAVKRSRSVVEYYFTCTPALPLYVLRESPWIDLITYVDADLFFFSDLEPLFDELGSGSIAIVAHRFPARLQHLENHGKYNVGILTFRQDAQGLACLHWWRERCLEWCYDYLEGGKYADQKYLDEWPEIFSGVVVLRHKGINVAPWNVGNSVISKRGGRIYVDGQPLVCFHFHGIKRRFKWVYDLNLEAYRTRPSSALLRFIYRPYIGRLSRLTGELASLFGQPATFSGSRHNSIPTLRPKQLRRSTWQIAQALRTVLRIGRRFGRRQYILVVGHQASHDAI